MATAINLLDELDILKSLDGRIRAVPPTDGAERVQLVNTSWTVSEPSIVAGASSADCEVILSDIAVAVLRNNKQCSMVYIGSREGRASAPKEYRS
jgi:hypothetical protein